jgi:hypothetical protein
MGTPAQCLFNLTLGDPYFALLEWTATYLDPVFRHNQAVMGYRCFQHLLGLLLVDLKEL